MLSLLYSSFLLISGVAAKNAFQFNDDDFIKYRTVSLVGIFTGKISG